MNEFLRHMKTKLLFLLLFISVTANSQTINTDSPSISVSSSTVQKNYFQIESNFGFSMNNDYLPIQNRGFNLPSALLRYGLLNRLELRATSAYQIQTTNSGFNRSFYTNLGFGAKYEILDKESTTKLALLAHYTSTNFFSWTHGTNATIALSQSIGTQHTIGANIGFELFAYNSIPEDVSTYDYSGSLIYNFSFLDKYSVFIEGYGSVLRHAKFSSGIKIDDVINYGFDFGLLFLLTDRIQLDYSSNISLSNKIHSHALGFNIMFPLKK